MTPTTRHSVAWAYTRAELEALFRVTRQEDVDKGGRYDARSAAINVYTHPWTHPETWEESTLMGTFYFRWDEPWLWQIETEAGFTCEDLCRELGRLELKALGIPKHGDPARIPEW